MAEALEEVGTLGPKDRPGKLFKPSWNATAKPAPGADKVSRPDLKFPPADVLKTDKLFPVRLIKGYRPMSDRAEIGTVIEQEDGTEAISYAPIDDESLRSGDGLALKIAAGSHARLPLSEAKEIIRRGIAERADAID